MYEGNLTKNKTNVVMRPTETKTRQKKEIKIQPNEKRSPFCLLRVLFLRCFVDEFADRMYQRLIIIVGNIKMICNEDENL